MNDTRDLGEKIEKLPTFAFATYVLLANSQIPFGISSLLFIAMALFHALKCDAIARAG
jgi:hypothetical protein